ncbi:MAG: hypothetical protein SNJ78_11335 [Spirochaetales bacterium]
MNLSPRKQGCFFSRRVRKTLIPSLALNFFVLIGLTYTFSQPATFHEARSSHYWVFSEVSATHAQQTTEYLEQLYSLFNRYFHFTGSPQGGFLKVRIFQTQEAFQRYLSLLIPEKREDFVYLHHTDPNRRELVAFYSLPSEQFYPSFHRQAFLQFLRSFILHPPLWLREGFAVFFEKIVLNPDLKTAEVRENPEWLDGLKKYLASTSSSGETLIPLDTFLFLSTEEARQKLGVFFPQAWGLVTFLLEAPNRSYQRFLWDTLSTLSSEATLEENYQRIRQRILPWYYLPQMEKDFISFLEQRPSFNSLLQQGITLYEKESFREALQAFRSAENLDPIHPLPPYYLGLVSYAMKDFASAEAAYQKALSLGGKKALIKYALGVNAFAWNKPQDARTYLTEALEADPSLREKIEPLMRRLSR